MIKWFCVDFQGLLYAHDCIAQKDYYPMLPEVPLDIDEEEETIKIVQLVKSNEPLVSMQHFEVNHLQPSDRPERRMQRWGCKLSAGVRPRVIKKTISCVNKNLIFAFAQEGAQSAEPIVVSATKCKHLSIPVCMAVFAFINSVISVAFWLIFASLLVFFYTPVATLANFWNLQGATIKTDEETGKIVIARIMHGGAADRSGLIHVGDEVIEVNNIITEGKTPNDVLQILVRLWIQRWENGNLCWL
jgi:PDZ domain